MGFVMRSHAMCYLRNYGRAWVTFICMQAQQPGSMEQKEALPGEGPNKVAQVRITGPLVCAVVPWLALYPSDARPPARGSCKSSPFGRSLMVVLTDVRRKPHRADGHVFLRHPADRVNVLQHIWQRII